MKNESGTLDKPSSDFSQIKKTTLHFLNQVETVIGHKPSIGLSDAQPVGHAKSGTPSSPLLITSEAALLLNRTEATVHHLDFQAEAYLQLSSYGHAGEFLECIVRSPKTRRVFVHQQGLLASVEIWASAKNFNQ